ncbi:MAG: AbrB family transcriptional regulator [Bacteroidetes bacterium QH_2_63_10]|nr:MAG: AbrB family transcriptional regulator [Bacteroidetes bacterium QH_2_63_10]
MSESTSQTIQVGKRGVVTLPKDVREKYGIEEGDALHLVDLGGGMFVVSPMMPAVPSLVEEIEAIREEEGVSLEELLAGLREQRERLTREVYGPDPEAEERASR